MLLVRREIKSRAVRLQYECATRRKPRQPLYRKPGAFTHVVISLPDATDILTLLRLLSQKQHTATTALWLTHPTQKQELGQMADAMYNRLFSSGQLQPIFKPIKPSRFGNVFDPTKERDASMDRFRGSAQQAVETQKEVFSRLEKEVGNKGHKVLLVEDNHVNQQVLQRFLAKVGLQVETAADGEECVEKVFSKTPGYYGLILCDLHMPRKDGFQATTEIREWESQLGVKKVPIVALSANVMSDVAEKCVTAGFSRYVTKPVDFSELSMTIKDLLPASEVAATTATTTDGAREETLVERERPLGARYEQRERAAVMEAARRKRESEAAAVMYAGGGGMKKDRGWR